MNTNELRQTFLDFFQQNGHTLVSSSSLVPAEDPTLLFTNAGMVQFKDDFLGRKSSSYVRATSSQRCVRAGGKHNDLENVGYTARHHTFFEMLGNFSFGDYFKSEAIKFAWTFLVGVLEIPAEKLWITVYEEDDEAASIWLNEIKIDPSRFSRCGDKDNFWAMGDTGPCGPCSEIFYDHGPEIPGGPPGSPDAEGDRYIEIWNLVFMQFNRSEDGTLTPLPKPSVDTGMGLERIAAVLQGVHNNYEIDSFRRLIAAIVELVKTPHDNHTSLQVIADHIRSCAFLITDGVMPSNEGRGYVLRRIIRRAVRHGHKLGLKEPFFHQLVAPLANEMGFAYPELTKARSMVEKVLLREEEQFAQTLDQGMKLLEQSLAGLKDATQIPGEMVFRLYDTYGFPPDLTADIARERGLTLDYEGFESAMEKQRQKSQAASQFTADKEMDWILSDDTEFTGYDQLTGQAKVVDLYAGSKPVKSLFTGEEGVVILDCTPFYAESGGQIGDKGQLFFEGGVFQVSDTQKKGRVYLHYGVLESGILKTGTSVTAEVDAARQDIMLNHSATHLLHSALRRLLGDHVIQKGSLVDTNRLRFDFSHFAPMTAEQLTQIEQMVNQQIRANLPCHTELMSPQEAKKLGAMALFDEKYGDEVRVLSMGEFSIELCGGTHTKQTGQIGLFKIIQETGIASGVRRIEAITGQTAVNWVNQQEAVLKQMAATFKTSIEETPVKLQQLLMQLRSHEKTIIQLKQQRMQSLLEVFTPDVIQINTVSVLVKKIPHADVEELRYLAELCKQKWEKSIVLLTTVMDGKAHLIAGVSKQQTQTIKAGDLVNFAAQQLGGKGGGRPDLAQGSGELVGQLEEVLATIPDWIQERMENT